MSRGKAFLFWTVIELHLFSCAFYLPLWKTSQVHRLNAWVIHRAPFPAHFSAPGNKSHLSLVSEVEKLTVPFRKNPPFVPTLLLMTNDIMKGLLLYLCSCYCWGVSQGAFMGFLLCSQVNVLFTTSLWAAQHMPCFRQNPHFFGETLCLQYSRWLFPAQGGLPLQPQSWVLRSKGCSSRLCICLGWELSPIHHCLELLVIDSCKLSYLSEGCPDEQQTLENSK